MTSRLDSLLARLTAERLRTAARQWQKAYRAALRRGTTAAQAKRHADRQVFSLA